MRVRSSSALRPSSNKLIRLSSRTFVPKKSRYCGAKREVKSPLISASTVRSGAPSSLAPSCAASFASVKIRPVSRGLPSVFKTTLAAKLSIISSPVIVKSKGGVPGREIRLATIPSAASRKDALRARMRVALEKAASSLKMPAVLSSRVMVSLASPSPSAIMSAPVTEATAATPTTGSPKETFFTEIAPIFTDTGSSGMAKLRASGRTVASAVPGSRNNSRLAAEISLIWMLPCKTDARFQSRTASFIVSQTPLSSAIVRLSKVARELSAPLNPVMTTLLPASESASSRYVVI